MFTCEYRKYKDITIAALYLSVSPSVCLSTSMFSVSKWSEVISSRKSGFDVTAVQIGNFLTRTSQAHEACVVFIVGFHVSDSLPSFGECGQKPFTIFSENCHTSLLDSSWTVSATLMGSNHGSSTFVVNSTRVENRDDLNHTFLPQVLQTVHLNIC